MLTVTQMQEISKSQNVIFYKPGCPFCFASRVLLDKLVDNKKIDTYKVYMLDSDFENETLAEFIQSCTTWRPTENEQFPAKPQIFLKGEYVGGNIDFYQSKWNTGEGMPNLPLTKELLNIKVARGALNAWQTGEKTGNYDEFKSLLSENFELFSHPLLGKFENQEAKDKLLDLIANREQNKNNLEFTNIKFTKLENCFVYEFNSEGTIQNGQQDYKGFNMIKLVLENDKVTAFQEYFGTIINHEK
jgi:glutaredoxin